MTKPVAPYSVAKAVRQIATLVDYPVMARLVRRSTRAVRFWSEDDKPGCPTIAQARILDVAYARAGGQGAPLSETLAALVASDVAEADACHRALAIEVAGASQDYGDVVAAVIPLTMPGATSADVLRAIAEVEQADGRTARLLARLRSFLPPALRNPALFQGGHP